MYVHDEAILFDTPEDIAVELNDAEISEVKHIFYTHWHPDHIMGMRIIEQLCTDWDESGAWRMAPKCKIGVHMPRPVHSEIMERFGFLFDFWERIGTAEVGVLADLITIGSLDIQHVTFETRHRTMTHSTVYVISQSDKKVIYAPCDVTPFPEDERFADAELLIIQMGWSGEEMMGRAEKGPHYEISMEEVVEVIEKYRPKQTILTHVGDEQGLTDAELTQLAEKYADYNVKIAYDGMTIEV